MRQVITNYSFDSVAGTITLPDFTALDISRLIMVVDATRSVILYNITDPARRATVAGNVITLVDVNTNNNNFANGDKLSITYDIMADDPDFQNPTVVQSETQTWREDFDDGALDTSLWTPTLTGAGALSFATAGVANLVLTSANGDSVTLRSKKSFRLPFRVQFGALISGRFANQVTILQVRNSVGDTVAAWVLDGAANTVAKIRSTHKGRAAVADTAVNLGTQTGLLQTFEIDARADSVDFINRVSDSGALGTVLGVRNRSILQPGEKYFIEISVANTSNTSAVTVSLETILVQELAKHVVEVAAARGQNSGSKSLPVSVTNQLQIAAGGNKIGMVVPDIRWYDENSTAQAAGATVTGTSRDLVGAASATQTINSFFKELRGLAISDVAGTLYLEVSRDNTNWRRIRAVPTSQPISGGLFVAELTYLPVTRYARLVYINGGTLQTHFSLNMGVFSS